MKRQGSRSVTASNTVVPCSTTTASANSTASDITTTILATSTTNTTTNTTFATTSTPATTITPTTSTNTTLPTSAYNPTSATTNATSATTSTTCSTISTTCASTSSTTTDTTSAATTSTTCSTSTNSSSQLASPTLVQELYNGHLCEFEDVVEEELVLCQLQGVVQAEITRQNLDKFKLLGVHTKNPILQVGGLVFEGKLEPTLGTAVFFAESPEDDRQAVADPVFSKRPEKNLRYTDKTQQMFTMKRVFIKKNDVQRERTERTETPKDTAA